VLFFWCVCAHAHASPTADERKSWLHIATIGGNLSQLYVPDLKLLIAELGVPAATDNKAQEKKADLFSRLDSHLGSISLKIQPSRTFTLPVNTERAAADEHMQPDEGKCGGKRGGKAGRGGKGKHKGKGGRASTAASPAQPSPESAAPSPAPTQLSTANTPVTEHHSAKGRGRGQGVVAVLDDRYETPPPTTKRSTRSPLTSPQDAPPARRLRQSRKPVRFRDPSS
jgi:hypothetical protein